MDTPAANWLLDALVVVLLGVALWLAASGPVLWIKAVLERLGAYDLPRRASAYANLVGADGGALARFFDHAQLSMTRNGDRAAVRVVLDERHAELRTRLAKTESTVREAVASVQGLAGQGGGATFLTEFNALRERTKLVDRIGVELSPELEAEYVQRKTAGGDLAMLIPLVVLIALANGGLMSVLFREMTSMMIFGVFPLAYGFGLVVVAAELGLGFFLYKGRANPLAMIGGLLLVLIATAFEAGAMSIFSVEFATALRGAEVADAQLSDYWMVLLAMVLTPVTCGLGYYLEKARAERNALKGKLQLGRELADCNRFVEELPGRWSAIDQKARSAEAAIERYQDVLGGQADRLAGAIDALAAERKALSAAITSARIEDWPNLVRGVEGDARSAAVQNIGLCLVSIAALALYAIGLAALVAAAYPASPPAFTLAAGLVGALVFCVIGNLAFNRLRLVQGDDGRAQPMSSQLYYRILAGILLAGCATGLIWLCVALLGGWGAFLGIFVTALGGVLSFLGYAAGRAARGLVLIATLVSSFAVAALSSILSLIRYALLWTVSALAWLLGFVVAVLARPAEALLEMLRRRAPGGTPAEARQAA